MVTDGLNYLMSSVRPYHAKGVVSSGRFVRPQRLPLLPFCIVMASMVLLLTLVYSFVRPSRDFHVQSTFRYFRTFSSLLSIIEFAKRSLLYNTTIKERSL
jgi:hypothetical protein